MRAGQEGQQWHRAEGSEDAEEHQHRTTPDDVGQRAERWLQGGVDQQGDERDLRGLVAGEFHGVDQEGRHIGGVGVERRCSAHGQAEHQQHRLGVLEQFAERIGPGLFRHLHELGRFDQPAPQIQAEHRAGGADEERHAPAPGFQLSAGELGLHQQQRQAAEHLAADQGDVLEAGVEAAVLRAGDLAEVGGGRAVFAAERKPLQQAGGEQNDRRPDAGGGEGRGDADHQRTQAHQRHRQAQRRTPAGMIGIDAEHPAADRADQEAHGIDAEGVQQLRGRVGIREERLGEIQREEIVDVEVIPLDQVADRSAENRKDPGAHGHIGFGSNWAGGIHLAFPLVRIARSYANPGRW